MPAATATRQKEELFVAFYWADPKRDGKAAAIEAGYAPSGAAVRAVELLARPFVKHELERLQKRDLASINRKSSKTLADVVAELEKIAFANTMDFIRINSEGEPVTDFSNITEAQAAAISEITVESSKDADGNETIKKTRFKLHDKKGALVDLGKHLGGFVQRNRNENTNVFMNPDGEPLEVKHKHEFVDPPKQPILIEQLKKK